MENKLDVDRYDRRLARIRQARKAVEDELARIEGRAARLDRLERDCEALLNHYARIVPEHLDSLEPAERNHVYKLLKLTVLAHQNGSLELSWALGADLCRDNEPLPPAVAALGAGERADLAELKAGTMVVLLKSKT